MFAASTDYFAVFEDVTGADLAAWRRARDLGNEVLTHINDDWEAATYPLSMLRRLGELDLLTDGLHVAGHETLSPLAAGLVNMQTARADGSLATVLAVQGGLALRSIVMHGSPEQIAKWAGPLATGQLLGAFALTEPEHGSDAVGLETAAVRDGDDWLLTGSKRWIGNGASGGISVVWARNEAGKVNAFVVDQDTPGYSATVIERKVSMRAIHQAAIELEGVRVPEANRLPGAASFKDTSAVLAATRYGVAWAAFGHGIACYEAALEHATTRIQFGRPLVANQLVQSRLSTMLISLTNMALQCRRLADLQAAGALRPEQASLAKVHNTRAARAIAADARDLLGGNGILLDNHVVRHMADIEALHTYEGTDTVQSLILGRDITGVGAFAS